MVIINNKHMEEAEDHRSKLEKEKEEYKQIQEKEKREKKEQEEYLQRLRNQIKEDRKANDEKSQIQNMQMLERIASAANPNLIPLTTHDSYAQAEEKAVGTLRIKISSDLQKKVYNLKETVTVGEFMDIVRKEFKIKRPKVYILAKGLIKLSNRSEELCSLGVSDMDSIHVQEE
ncbi:hypothetical protein NEFER03_1218 [Nematocida sp. LUAm3]|nr:hypothetical protein NEFER03_1218 [Nematocida sp. LUAm3]KAI5175827.1 hypothetical protein NEFER02_1696 [Nematocida sp. LUAm2]KAI5178323.1 hypothetical protein NEFER01_1490 [Nematocida sp. LUAm1]